MGPLSGASIRTFVAPSRYVQGADAVEALGTLVARRRQRAAVLVDAPLVDSIGKRIIASLEEAGVPSLMVPAAGEVTLEHIAALAEAARGHGPDVVVAAGGGKALDLGKGVARELRVPVVTVPTIASNDGPASRVIALYDEEHRLIGTPQLVANPELVVVDTAVIAAAPDRFLRSGIGDAIAKRFEADACRRAGGLTSHGQRPLVLPEAIAEGCYRVLLEDAPAALERDPEAFERVVEAAVLMSGLAFENGGLSLAHAMTRGLMVCAGAREHLHGYHVAYGLLVQLAHERDPAYETVRAFLREIGLPRALSDLDASADADTLIALARSAVDSPHRGNCDPAPTIASVVEALERVEGDASGERATVEAT